MAELSARARQILYACITEFVATGEPVGSRTLSKKHGIDLSAASIRNVLSDLEEWGYLHQPHTSAGRVPTAKAFQFYVRSLSAMRIAATEAERVRSELSGLQTLGAHMERSSVALTDYFTVAVARKS